MPDGEQWEEWEEYLLPKWGITAEQLRFLFKGINNSYALTQYLRQLIDDEQISEDQADLIKEYLVYRWNLGNEALRINLPAGSSASDVYRRVIASGQTLNQASWDRLQKGMDMEREQIRQRARLQTEEARRLAGKPSPLPIIPPAGRGAWTPEAREYELGRAQLWITRQEAERRAENKEERRRWIKRRAREKAGGEPTYIEEEAPRTLAEAEADRAAWEAAGKPKPTPLEISPEETRRLTRTFTPRERKRWPRLEVPYTPPLYEEAGVTGPYRWRDWWESKYGPAVREFLARPFTQRKAEAWTQYISKTQQREYEEWYGRGPYARGERPEVYQPPIQTVRF